MNQISKVRSLFCTFFKIGICTFGGGYAMLRLIEHEVTQKKQWVDKTELLDIIAISESTPGPIAVNCATFIGYQAAGIGGALAATLGVTLPSFFIICILSVFLQQYSRIQWLRWAFEGIRAGIAVLILTAAVSLSRECPRNNFTAIVMVLVFLSAAFLNVSVILLLIFAALAGILRQVMLSNKLKDKNGGKP